MHRVLISNIVDFQKTILNHTVADNLSSLNDPKALEHYLKKYDLLPELSFYDKEMNMLANNFDMQSDDESGRKYNNKTLRQYLEKMLPSQKDGIFNDEEKSLLIMPIMIEDKIVAYAVSSYESAIQDKMVIINQTFMYQIFIITFIVMIISTFVIIFSLKLLYPLELLIEGIKNITAGNLSSVIKNTSNDEIAVVIDAFNDMTLKRKLIEDELREMATHDGLTGLYNHKYFYTLLEDELPRADRYQHDISLLMLDIDNFKNINDSYGHRSGDAILHTLSKRLVERVRGTDWVCRYGGEEIAILLPETDLRTAEEIAESLRVLIEQEVFLIEDDQQINITASIGVSTYPEHAKNASALVSAADKALYEAKNTGRNRVCVYDEAKHEKA
jgi:diguanylate cyclase (GGDEF)-like protein